MELDQSPVCEQVVARNGVKEVKRRMGRVGEDSRGIVETCSQMVIHKNMTITARKRFISTKLDMSVKQTIKNNLESKETQMEEICWNIVGCFQWQTDSVQHVRREERTRTLETLPPSMTNIPDTECRECRSGNQRYTSVWCGACSATKSLTKQDMFQSVQ
ncbi:hypothetical protein CBL_10523 [Carabus blaptoides fortunei]